MSQESITDSEILLRRVHETIATARTIPLSSSPMINRDEVLELLDEANARLPEELRQARWLLRERDEFLAKTRREADDILDAARAQAERMVQRTEVNRAAELRARQILESADAEARKLTRETEDYCDRHLARFEIVLDKVAKTVAIGRERLTGAGSDAATGAQAADAPVDADDDVVLPYDFDSDAT
jgi:cell division septum initiation protein DivIVA